MVRTRFAPSPTGYLHIGGARTALFCWAFAKQLGGTFILRIEDTDQERSTDASVQAILDGMHWLGLDYEGPYYQMQRLDSYRRAAERLVQEGKAYYCYATRDEIDQLREAQRARGEKPRYDGRWRPENALKLGLKIPNNHQPVIRFRNPDSGVVVFNDLVKGAITVANTELDDLVIMRADGIPTYNFGVVIDDIDMQITHVVRGDDHVNNTPRQINIYHALGAVVPEFAHLPMILGADGERLSKRHGAVSVMQYFEDGFLPEALNNYLARLGWSHGDAEKFSLRQMVEWFDLAHVSRSPARFDPEKLHWLNQQYLKETDDGRLADLVAPFMQRIGVDVAIGAPLSQVVSLLKERVQTVEALADAAVYFYRAVAPHMNDQQLHYTAAVHLPLMALHQTFESLPWERTQIAQAIKSVVAMHQLKFPQIAMPLRVMVSGGTQTPSVDVTLELIGRTQVLERMAQQLEFFPHLAAEH